MLLWKGQRSIPARRHLNNEGYIEKGMISMPYRLQFSFRTWEIGFILLRGLGYFEEN